MFAFTVRQIEIFLAVCELGSFRRAADALGISEAGVSNHIRALERQLDCQLFARRRGAKVTPLEACEALRAEALAFVDRGRELRLVATRHSNQRPPLKVFVGGHLLEDFVRPALPRLASEHPDIELQFVTDRSRDQIIRESSPDEFDIILVTVRDKADLPGSILLSEVVAGIYGHAKYVDLAKKSGLAALPFIASPSGSEEEREQRNALRKLGIANPIIAQRSQFHDGKILAAVSGGGVTMSLQSIVDKYDRNRILVMIHQLNNWQRCLYINPRLDDDISEIIKKFFLSSIVNSAIQ
jgi:DNA-binding transcriptional LysR family regulator